MGEADISLAKAKAGASPLVQLGPREGQPRGFTAESNPWDSPPGVRGRWPQLGPRVSRVPSGKLSGGSELPRAPLARPGRPRRGSLRAKGIFLWILPEASAATRGASPHPLESWR